EILDARLDLTLGDMIPEEERVVTISHGGYAKTQIRAVERWLTCRCRFVPSGDPGPAIRPARWQVLPVAGTGPGYPGTAPAPPDGLEHEKLLAEYQEILNQIGELIRILNSAVRLMEVIREELEVIRAEYGDVRRTEILDARLDLTLGDMIPEEERVVTISHGGYAKTQ
ncbi:hypothetical protein ACQXZP_12680, partial [Corynebacterium diphtheriae]